MKSRLLVAAALAGAIACASSSAGAGVLVPIPLIPGSAGVLPSEVNNSNVINGWYYTPDGVAHGFVGTLDGNYTTFNVAGDGGSTEGQGMNDGGYQTLFTAERNDDCLIQGCEYLRTSRGDNKPIVRGTAQLDGVPGQIIEKQKFVGSYDVMDKDQNVFFYGYYGKGTKYVVDLTLPFNTNRTRPRGYDSAGTVTGYFNDLDEHDIPGFVLKNGTVTAVRYPDSSAFETVFRYLNKKEIVAGYWEEESSGFDHAFLYKISTNAFMPIDVPGAMYAYAQGINDAGVVAITADGVGYIYCPKRKTCPIHSPREIEIHERWISAANYSRTLPCKNGCMGPHHESAHAPRDPAAVRAAIARDPDLQRELRLPLRP